MTIEAAVRVVAERMLKRYESEYSADHLTWADFADAARGDLMAVLPIVQAEALEEAAEKIVISRGSGAAAAWLQGRASRLRGDLEVSPQVSTPRG